MNEEIAQIKGPCQFSRDFSSSQHYAHRRPNAKPTEDRSSAAGAHVVEEREECAQHLCFRNEQKLDNDEGRSARR